jgi:hypothetical protein
MMALVDAIQTQGLESGWHLSVIQLVHLAVQLSGMCLKSIQYPAHQSRWIQLEQPHGWRLATIWVCSSTQL